jgi:ABC-type dipeptide/oligopeptide/nickel transport system ATPase subunit
MKVTTPFTITAADSESRTITGQIVAFDTAANASTGKVMFKQGSLNPTNVKLNLEHDSSRPIGKTLSMEFAPDGKSINATFKISKTTAGSDAIQEAIDGLRDGFSVEAMAKEFGYNEDGTMVVVNGGGSFIGEAIDAFPAARFHAHPRRRDIQLVFQDPGDSLNPRFSACQSIADPLRKLLGLSDPAELRRRATFLAERCGLEGSLLDRFPHQLSGGQRARVGIARAIACEPKLLVLDEPTAALDVSVQAVILNLLDRLRRDTGLGFLFVSHDLNVVRMMCERTVVLQAGRVVETGPSARLFSAPTAPYTAALLAAIPHFNPPAALTPAARA